MLSTVLSVFFVTIALIYYLLQKQYSYWNKQNVPSIKPTPILGNYGDFIFQKKHMAYVTAELYNQFPNEPYIGTFFGTSPTLIVKDLELLKLITTKDFYNFNSREAADHIHKEEFARNLFNNCGDQWKVLRQNLTPVFTTAKMRNMFHLIAKCSYEFENLLDEEAKKDDFPAREHIARFTMACIVSCAYGIDSATMGDKYKNNPFTKAGDKFSSGSKFLSAKLTFKTLWPSIFYSLGLQAAPPGINEMFKKFMVSVFEARQYKSTSRNDFVDFILKFKQNSHLVGDSISNLKTGGSKKVQMPVTDDLLASQCLLFFLAGFDTSATTTNYTLFQLAKHPDIQKKVQEEIDAYLLKNGNQLTYDVVNELPYTYACIEETLRLYPVIGVVTREVTEDYTLPTGVFLERGTRIHLPVYSIHRDPRHFPEPELFRSERFLGEERQKIASYSFMPFGEGSRICIGKLFRMFR